MNRVVVNTLAVAILLTSCSAENQAEVQVLQSMLDEARTEIAQLSAELEQFRQAAAVEQESRSVVAAFFEPDADWLELLHEDYVQHNPVFKRFGEMNEVSGKDEARVLLSYFFPQNDETEAAEPSDPGVPQGDPTYLVLADGDVGVVLQQRWLPDPMNEGEFYEAFWFDAWRVRDGVLYEHWDAAIIEEPLPVYLKAPLERAEIDAALGR